MTCAVFRGFAALVAAATAGTIYWVVVRRWLLRWGGMDHEVSLPGDDVVPRPRYVATRAVTIAAPAAAIWP